MTLTKEDFEEPVCPLCDPNTPTCIPTDRVIRKLDEYLNKNDMAGAKRHLLYWHAEARNIGDRRGLLAVVNEQIGLYRKTAHEAEALEAVALALSLVNDEKLGESVTGATTYINAATAYKAFGRASDALPLYEKAKTLYESLLSSGDGRLGGLYNNMALTVAELGDYERAQTLFSDALAIMGNIEGGEAEMAVTYCNLADLAAARYGTEDGERMIFGYLETAMRMLDTEALSRDGYYAFVCEKCAPTFGYYGFFSDERELLRRAKQIHSET